MIIIISSSSIIISSSIISIIIIIITTTVISVIVIVIITVISVMYYCYYCYYCYLLLLTPRRRWPPAPRTSPSSTAARRPALSWTWGEEAGFAGSIQAVKSAPHASATVFRGRGQLCKGLPRDCRHPQRSAWNNGQSAWMLTLADHARRCSQSS